jgi:hypothetical protein
MPLSVAQWVGRLVRLVESRVDVRCAVKSENVHLLVTGDFEDVREIW